MCSSSSCPSSSFLLVSIGHDGLDVAIPMLQADDDIVALFHPTVERIRTASHGPEPTAICPDRIDERPANLLPAGRHQRSFLRRLLPFIRKPCRMEGGKPLGQRFESAHPSLPSCCPHCSAAASSSWQQASESALTFRWVFSA